MGGRILIVFMIKNWEKTLKTLACNWEYAQLQNLFSDLQKAGMCSIRKNCYKCSAAIDPT